MMALTSRKSWIPHSAYSRPLPDCLVVANGRRRVPFRIVQAHLSSTQLTSNGASVRGYQARAASMMLEFKSVQRVNGSGTTKPPLT